MASGKCQRSKKAREIKRQAVSAGLPTNFSHPSHVAGVDRCARRYRHKVYSIINGRIRWVREGERCSGMKWFLSRC